MSAVERDRRRTRVRGLRAGWADVLLLAAACAAVVAIGLAYRGRMRAFDQLERERAKPGTRIVNLNTVGYIILALFVLTWMAALALWRWGRIEERWSASPLESE